jgi:hypothetical protein
MPACNAERHIASSVISVLSQSYKHWELVIASDDGRDYISILKTLGISDSRIKMASTGGIRTGISNARNVALAAAENDYIALLDSDDRFAPEKLALCAEALGQYDIITNALELRTEDDKPIFCVGTSVKTGALSPARHKFVNFSADSTICVNRKKINLRFDETKKVLEDIEALIHCFTQTEKLYHFSFPLHLYRKYQGTVSTAADAANIFIQTKNRLAETLRTTGYAGLSDETRAGLLAFLGISTQAEAIYGAQEDPSIYFEHIIRDLIVSPSA